MIIAVKSAFVFLMLAACFSGVTSWIVDMAEVDRLQVEELLPEQVPDYEEVDETDNEVTYTSNYAGNYQYGSFKEKEVSNVLQDGGEYLAGLSGALAAYRRLLQRCSITQTETPQSDEEACEKAEQKKHLVQELSQVALSTTDKLKDKAQIQLQQDESEEEADLILLARSLDRLATLTGYQPARESVSTPPHQSSDNSSTETTKVNAEVTTQADTEQNLEILEQVENGRPLANVPTPSTDSEVKSVQKRDTSDIMKYYIKYKVWNGSNPIHDRQSHDNYDEMDPANAVKVLRKRSVADKKAANMRAVIDKMRRLKCKIKEKMTKHSVAKLIKSVKVYRRKIVNNTT